MRNGFSGPYRSVNGSTRTQLKGRRGRVNISRMSGERTAWWKPVLLAAVLGLLTTGIIAGVRQFADRESPTATITISPSSAEAGQPVTILGEGFDSNERIVVTFTDVNLLATAADRSGSFTDSFEVPQRTPGDWLVAATGETSGRRATSRFVIEFQ